MKLNTYLERVEYLRTNNSVGGDGFGYDRYLNQMLYKSNEWKKIRSKVILRDNGCDLGLEDRPIYFGATIHHINPILKEDILEHNPIIFDMDNLISVSSDTHRIIHYAKDISKSDIIDRKRNDTCPWKE